jgi:hypothetical protein
MASIVAVTRAEHKTRTYSGSSSTPDSWYVTRTATALPAPKRYVDGDRSEYDKQLGTDSKNAATVARSTGKSGRS